MTLLRSTLSLALSRSAGTGSPGAGRTHARVQNEPKTVVFRAKITAKSRRTEVVGTLSDGETIKIHVADPADKGKANSELRAFLAQEFGVPRDQVKIISGLTSPLKLVRITL